MYPRNATTPKPIFAKVVNASDGSPITSGVQAFHINASGTRAEGSGSLGHVYNGLWRYLPTQFETNESAFAIEFYHADAVGDGPVVEVVTTDKANELGAAVCQAVRGPRQLYVDPINGSDTNDGWSWNTAKETIAAANAIATAGDTVNLAGGDHDQGSTPLQLVAGVRYRGAGMGITRILGADIGSGPVVRPAAGTVLEDLSVIHTGSGYAAIGEWTSGANVDGAVLRRVYASSSSVAVRLIFSNSAVVRAIDCVFEGADSAHDLLVNDGTVKAQVDLIRCAAYLSEDSAHASYLLCANSDAGELRVTAIDCTFASCHTANPSPATIYACGSAVVVLQDCVVHDVNRTDPSYERDLLVSDSAVIYCRNVNVRRDKVVTQGDGSIVYLDGDEAADAVLDELLSEHTTEGSAGEALKRAGSSITTETTIVCE